MGCRLSWRLIRVSARGLGRHETCPYGEGWGIGGVADKALGLFLHRRGWGEWREITNETS